MVRNKIIIKYDEILQEYYLENANSDSKFKIG
jgi:hypothetical protein